MIKTAPRERFVDYYTRFYTPERMTFVVVGDVDPAQIEARIRESFSSMANPAEPGKNPEIGAIKSPGNAPGAITVGALNTFNTPQRSDDQVLSHIVDRGTHIFAVVLHDVHAHAVRQARGQLG